MHIESFLFQRSRGNYEVAMCNDKENKTAKLDTEEGKKESHILMEGKYQRILYFEEKQKYFFQLLSFLLFTGKVKFHCSAQLSNSGTDHPLLQFNHIV